nr:aminoacetone oxidase family FAD-binding enzyme [uncultured Mogibacterium sp.]
MAQKNKRGQIASSGESLPKFLRCDILIIGGGPSGMAAAISAKRSNAELEVVLLEKNEVMGRKLRATGNGRCNITNVKAKGFTEVIKFLSSIGIVTKTNDRGFLYPVSESAADVSDLLELRIEQLGVKVYKGVSVEGITRNADEQVFETLVNKLDEVYSCNHIVKSTAVIVAVGGKSAPVYGSTGDGYKWLRELGHTVTRLVPSLTPIECGDMDLSKLSGIRVSAEAKLVKSGEEIHREDGEVQFTKFGLSGICVFNLSRMMRFDHGDTFDSFEIELDLCQDLDLQDVLKEAAERADAVSYESGKHEKLVDVFKTVFKVGLAHEVIRQAGIAADADAEVLMSESNREKIVVSARALKFHPTGQKGWKDAQCTSGGVAIGEVDDTTFESNLVSNLYIVGEVLDYDGFCGGYNLNHAFLSGKRAGTAASDNIYL